MFGFTGASSIHRHAFLLHDARAIVEVTAPPVPLADHALHPHLEREYERDPGESRRTKPADKEGVGRD